MTRFGPPPAALLEEACGAGSSELVVGEGFGKDARIYFAGFYRRGERRRDFEAEYLAVYHPRDERVPRLRRLPDSRLVPMNDLYSDQEKKTSAVYNEALPRAGTQNGLNVRLDGPNGLRIVCVLGDPVGTGDWDSSRIEVIGNLLPHVRQYVRVRQALESAHAVETSLVKLMDHAGVGVILLDRRSRVIETSDRAHELLSQGDTFCVQDGSLRAVQARDNVRLERLFDRALPTFSRNSAVGSMTIGSPLRSSRLVVHLIPVGSRQVDFDSQRVSAIVLVEEPGGNLPPWIPIWSDRRLALTRPKVWWR